MDANSLIDSVLSGEDVSSVLDEAAKRKKRKLTGKMDHALRAAARHGIVAGGMDASFSVHSKLRDAGLIAHTGPGADSITDKGKQALKDGFYFMEAIEEAKKVTGAAIKKVFGVTTSPKLIADKIERADWGGSGYEGLPYKVREMNLGIWYERERGTLTATVERKLKLQNGKEYIDLLADLVNNVARPNDIPRYLNNKYLDV